MPPTKIEPASWRTELTSGFLVSLIALPLSLGIASASGFPPVMGVLTAIVGGLVVSFFAGSEPTIKGPAAGLIVVVAGCVEALGQGDQLLGWQRTLPVLLAAGAIQVVLGKMRVARLADFFPLAAVHGMLAAIGLIILSKQSHLLLGMAPGMLVGKTPVDLLLSLPNSLATLNIPVATISSVSLLILYGWPHLPWAALRRLPAALVVLVVAVAVGQAFGLADPVRFGAIKPLLNPGTFSVDRQLDPAQFGPLVSGTLWPVALKYLIMFALIGSLESVLTGRAIDLLDPLRRRSDLSRDVAAVGVGNMVSALLGGLPMIAEVARSSANLANGGRTRWANFAHGAFLLVFMLALIPLLTMVPVAALAAILITVGVRLANPKEFRHMYAIGPEQFVVFVATIVVTLCTDLLMGIGAGIAVEFALQALLGMPMKDLFRLNARLTSAGDHHLLTVNGSVTFTNYLALKKYLDAIPAVPDQHVTVDLHRARYVDHTVMESLHQYERDLTERGGQFRLINLDAHRPLSAHPRAARRKRIVMVEELA